jgi:hypothetical protein
MAARAKTRLVRSARGATVEVRDGGAVYAEFVSRQEIDIVRKAAELVRDEAKRLLSLKGYPPGHELQGTSEYHSKPGEPPYWHTKKLLESVGIDDEGLTVSTTISVAGNNRRRDARGRFTAGPSARVGTALDYGFWLELGFVHYWTGKTVRRQWLRPALDNKSSEIRQMFKRHLRKPQASDITGGIID